MLRVSRAALYKPGITVMSHLKKQLLLLQQCLPHLAPILELGVSINKLNLVGLIREKTQIFSVGVLQKLGSKPFVYSVASLA